MTIHPNAVTFAQSVATHVAAGADLEAICAELRVTMGPAGESHFRRALGLAHETGPALTTAEACARAAAILQEEDDASPRFQWLLPLQAELQSGKPREEWSPMATALCDGHSDGLRWKRYAFGRRLHTKDEQAAYGAGFSSGRGLAEGMALGG